jgi:hypothetical protein
VIPRYFPITLSSEPDRSIWLEEAHKILVSALRRRKNLFMRYCSPLLVCFVASIFPLAAQNASQPASTAATTPVAYVYLASGTNSTGYQINAFSAASNGKLTAVPGSPVTEKGFYLATSKNWLFSTDTVDIYSFSIAADGALKKVSSVNAQKHNSYPTGGPVSLFSDRTGANLYDEDIYSDGSNNAYQSFTLDEHNGSLSYLSTDSTVSADFQTPLSFIGNDEFGYGASCILGSNIIYGFGRASDGSLTDIEISPEIPSAKQGSYCPWDAAGDNASNVAISMTPTDDTSMIGPPQLAVYTADGGGNLTTSSTADNMPATVVVNVNAIAANPAGNLLAVAGTNGLEVFHFNASNPVTRFTGALTTDNIYAVAWDNSNHLYAFTGGSSGKLYVFNVTSTTVNRAPGSPYSIPNATGLAVLSKQ